MCFYFSIALVVLCFCWVHFWWCGYVYGLFFLWMSIKDLEVVRKIRGGATRWSRSSSFASLEDVLRNK